MEELSNQNMNMHIELYGLSEEVSDNLHVFPRRAYLFEGVLAIKNSGSLFQCPILGLNEEEPQEHEFGRQPADIDQLHVG